MFNGNQHSGINYHRKFMFEAFKLAEKASEQGEVPVGAVIVQENRIIGRGYNQVEMLKDPTAHAEMIAISSACATIQEKYLTGCTLYVTLEPCPMCSGALVWSKMERVVFGAADDGCGGCGSRFNIAENRELNHSVEVIQGVMEADCSWLLRDFFGKRRS